ncbi:MAG: glycine cleavage T C-terminal barrel domain-containing protein [Bacteroidota bacterium]|nr:hypothetical protein [Candidatus Kapabacteria bacterium]MDW8220255.1 glycine cleavage T C-terminal barrel domain-containing protein [Bacteroidota bacterium]
MTDLYAYTTAKSVVGWRRHQYDIVRVTGRDRFDLLHRMTTNNVVSLNTSSSTHVGLGIRNVFLTEKARIIDVCTMLAREEEILLILSAGMAANIIAWLDAYTFIEDFRTDDITVQYVPFLVFGAQAVSFIEELAKVPLDRMRVASWLNATVEYSLQKIEHIILVQQPPLCTSCFLLLVPAEHAAVCEKMLQTIDSIAAVGDDVFEVLRIEAGWGKHGAEWTSERNPLEAGLIGLVDFTKGCYIGQEVIARLDTYNKVKMRCMGLRADTPIHLNMRLVDTSDAKHEPENIGIVTSTAYSPELQQYIALGYVRSQFANPGVRVLARSIDDNATEQYSEIEIVALPFLV